MKLSLLLFFAFLFHGYSGQNFDKKTGMSTVKIMLDTIIWTKFLNSYKIVESYKKEYITKSGQEDRIRIIRPKKINDPQTLEFNGVIQHTMDNFMKINITVDISGPTNFTINVGTTTSSCQDLTEPYGRTCVRGGDYRVYSDHGPKLMHQCILVFWPKYRSGGRFCYKMYNNNKKTSLNYNNVIVSAAGDDDQAVYLPVIENSDGWKVLKFHEDSD